MNPHKKNTGSDGLPLTYRSMYDMWREFYKSVTMGGKIIMPPDQEYELKQSFFAGFTACMGQFTVCLSRDVNEQMARGEMDRWIQETQDDVVSLVKGRRTEASA